MKGRKIKEIDFNRHKGKKEFQTFILVSVQREER